MKFKFGNIINVSILLLGIIIAIIQFYFNTSLFADEASLSLNIIIRSYSELMHPLDNEQVAPILFLFIEKFFSSIITNSEYGLRIFPLISYVVSLILFIKIIQLFNWRPIVVVFSLSLIVFNPFVIRYSNEIKQYISDMFIYLTLFYFSTRAYKDEIKRYFVLGLLGVVAVFLSNIAPILLLTVACHEIVCINKRNIKLPAHMIFMFSIWLIAFMFYYINFINNHPLKAFMLNYWSNLNAFMPMNPFTVDFAKFLFGTWKKLFLSLFGFRYVSGIIISLLFLLSINILIMEKKIEILILALMPLCLHLCISAFKLYPIGTRLLLYTLPSIIIIASFGLNILLDYLAKKESMMHIKYLEFIVVLLMLFNLYGFGQFPIQKSEIKSCLSILKKQMKPGDKLFINYFSKNKFLYYRDISYFQIDVSQIIMDTTPSIQTRKGWTFDSKKYIEEISKIKGKTWFIFTDHGDGESRKKCFLEHYSNRVNIVYQNFDSYVFLLDSD